jgi:hypothetical protein
VTKKHASAPARGYVRRALVSAALMGAGIMACLFGAGSALSAEGGLDVLRSLVFGVLVGLASGGLGGVLAGALVALSVTATRKADVVVSAVCAGLVAAVAPGLTLLLVLGRRDGLELVTRAPFVVLSLTAALVAAASTPYVRTGQTRRRRTEMAQEP